MKYCVGRELEKTDSELVDGKCPIHPNLELELIDEENYFFRFSKYQKPLFGTLRKISGFCGTAHRLTEIRNFVASGLQDFSVSRLKSKMPWGVPVPGDDMQIMYVWFDALTNYISTLGWPEDDKKFGDFGYERKTERAPDCRQGQSAPAVRNVAGDAPIRRLATFPADNHPWFYHKRRAEDEQEFGECGESV